MGRPKKVVEDIKEEIKQENVEVTDTNVGEPKHLDLINKITEVRNSLDEIDEYFNSISANQSKNDKFITDLLHYVELYDLTEKQSKKLLDLLKEKRYKRRQLKKEWEIKRVYDNGRQKFGYENQRDMFMASIYKKEKELSTQYNCRIISFEDITDIINGKKTEKDCILIEKDTNDEDLD